MTPEQIAAVKDPARRAREAQGFIARGESAITEVRGIRDQAIREWRQTATQRAIAKALGLTPGLIGQIDAAAKEQQ